VLFIDDTEPNVLGARAAGLHALLHVDHATTRGELAGLFPALGADAKGSFAR
jgi:putative hydrolase of the HAD superfamily